MPISKDAIVQKTHYGIKIYANILRHYYPDKCVLQLAGKKCMVTLNPFNDGKPTLKIQILNNLAIHQDLENTIKDGDAFDFAALHYNLTGDELYEKLNQELYLKIGQNFNFYTNQSTASIGPEPSKILIPSFSYFKAPISNIFPHQEINLLKAYNLIIGNTFERATQTLRTITNKNEARKFKAANFDYVTFSGLFSKRNDAALQRHSSLITIDFDHLDNLIQTKELLLNDSSLETELLFTSPSGDGLKWITNIDLTVTSHQNYFKAISNYLKETYNLILDQSGKDVSRACFLCHDANAYINPKYL